MIYLDTHVVVWLYQKEMSRFTPEAISLIDRVITAHASLDNSILVTKDKNIRKNYAKALW